MGKGRSMRPFPINERGQHTRLTQSGGTTWGGTPLTIFARYTHKLSGGQFMALQSQKEESTMTNQQVQGLALILFGILLCAGGNELNRLVFHSISDLPFSLIGLIVGIFGLVRVFMKNGESK